MYCSIFQTWDFSGCVVLDHRPISAASSFLCASTPDLDQGFYHLGLVEVKDANTGLSN